jgi:hypothetical protein
MFDLCWKMKIIKKSFKNIIFVYIPHGSLLLCESDPSVDKRRFSFVNKSISTFCWFFTDLFLNREEII